VEYEHIEPVRGSSTDEIIIGGSSWDGTSHSVKYAWPDSRGHRARGGEMPVSVVPQMIEALVREGYLPAADVLDAVAGALRSEAGEPAAS
jgi:hypothetical protein